MFLYDYTHIIKGIVEIIESIKNNTTVFCSWTYILYIT